MSEISYNQDIQIRIIVGSYEHNLLCVSLLLPKGGKSPVFTPIFHFQAHSLSVRSMDVAQRYLITGSNDEHIKIYDLQKRKELGTLLQHTGSITVLKFSDDAKTPGQDKTGKWLLSGSEDGKIIIWRTKDWEIFGELKGHKGRINDLAIHPSGKVAVSVSNDKTIRLWNLMSAKKASALKLKGRDTLGQHAEFVEWSQSGEHFFVGLSTKLLVYETRSAEIIKIINLTSPIMKLGKVVLGGIEYVIIAFGDGSIRFFALSDILKSEERIVADLKSTFELRGHASRVKGFQIYRFSEESLFLVSISSDGKIVVWDLEKRDQIAVYDCGERLNVVSVVSEEVEKALKPRLSLEQNDMGDVSESEVESDGELKRVMKGNLPKKKRSKVNNKKIAVKLE